MENDRDESASGHVPISRPDIVLNSPAGHKAAVYKWPLTYKVNPFTNIDGANEIIENIRWVAKEYPEFKMAVENLLSSKEQDVKDYDYVKSICDKYNKIVDQVIRMYRGTSLTPKRSPKANNELLKHILHQVYSRAVTEPHRLNEYEPFSSDVYGETPFEFVSQMIEELDLKDDDVFIDLGSGVGQVVLQMAAASPCKKCVGIEKADAPSTFATIMDEEFKFWMEWHGKVHKDYELISGDFFDQKFRSLIKQSTCIFINNYSYEPEDNHRLKLRFIDLKEGTKIVSSRPFCPPKNRETERVRADIGSILTVREILPQQPVADVDSISPWSDRPPAYYIHMIDALKLQEYNDNLRKQHQESAMTVKLPASPRKKTTLTKRRKSESIERPSLGATTRKAWSELCSSVTSPEVIVSEDLNVVEPLVEVVCTPVKETVSVTDQPDHQATAVSKPKEKSKAKAKAKAKPKTNPQPDVSQPIQAKCAATSKASKFVNTNDAISQGPSSLSVTYDLNAYLGDVQAKIRSFTEYMQTPAYRQSLTEQTNQENGNREALARKVGGIERELVTLQMRAASSIQHHCSELGIVGEDMNSALNLFVKMNCNLVKNAKLIMRQIQVLNDLSNERLRNLQSNMSFEANSMPNQMPSQSTTYWTNRMASFNVNSTVIESSCTQFGTNLAHPLFQSLRTSIPSSMAGAISPMMVAQTMPQVNDQLYSRIAMPMQIPLQMQIPLSMPMPMTMPMHMPISMPISNQEDRSHAASQKKTLLQKLADPSDRNQVFDVPYQNLENSFSSEFNPSISNKATTSSSSPSMDSKTNKQPTKKTVPRKPRTAAAPRSDKGRNSSSARTNPNEALDLSGKADPKRLNPPKAFSQTKTTISKKPTAPRSRKKSKDTPNNQTQVLQQTHTDPKKSIP